MSREPGCAHVRFSSRGPCIQCLQDRAAKAEAEVERLRAELDDWKGRAHGEAASRQALQGQVTELRAELEATNGAKGEWERLRNESYRLYRDTAAQLAAANALLAEPRTTWSYEHFDEWRARIRAHLAGQSAAAVEHCKLCGKDPDAYVLDSEFVRVCKERDALKERAAAEQRVLDAASAIHPRSLVRPLQYVGDWEEFVEAELARREGK